MQRKFVLNGLPYHDAFAFVADGASEASVFQKLIDHTKQALAVEGVEFNASSYGPDQSMMYYLGRLSVQFGRKVDDGKLQLAWSAWERRYRDLEANNPALELYDKLSWISEGHEGSSWPFNREELLRDWVLAGAEPSDFPLVDGYQLLTPPFCLRLIYLMKTLNGWMYMDDAGDIELR